MENDLRECNKTLAKINLNNAGKIAELENKLRIAENALDNQIKTSNAEGWCNICDSHEHIEDCELVQAYREIT